MPRKPAPCATPRRPSIPQPGAEFGFKRLRLNAAGAADPVLGRIGDDSGGFLAIQWHDDAWELPAGAELLVSGDAWPNQAFRYGPDVLAIQFHLEFTQSHMAWAVNRPEEGTSLDPEAEERATFAASSPRYDEIKSSMENVLSGLLIPQEAPADARPQGAVEVFRALK